MLLGGIERTAVGPAYMPNAAFVGTAPISPAPSGLDVLRMYSVRSIIFRDESRHLQILIAPHAVLQAKSSGETCTGITRIRVLSAHIIGHRTGPGT